MNTFLLKLILAPLIIGGASLAGRRWGPAVSGWLVGLPLTSGPVVYFVASSQGEAFAQQTGLGVISGGLSLVVYCLTYAWIAVRFGWPVAITGSLLCFSATTILMQNVFVPLLPIFGLVFLALVAGLKLLPKESRLKMIPTEPGKWDIPARILVGTAFILLVTGIAPWIGSRLTGLLTTIPLYGSILAIFAHRLHGPAGAASVMRGLILGMFGFASFYLVLIPLLGLVPLGVVFLAATLAALGTQGLSLLVLRRSNG